MRKTVCFCFGFTAEDIEEDVRRHRGRSLILERIVAEKKRGACRCAELNPENR